MLALALGLALGLSIAERSHAQPAPEPRPAIASDPRAEADPAPLAWPERPDVQAWIAEAAPRLGLDAAWMRAQVARARHSPAVTRLIMPPPAGTARNWAAYRARFVEPVRIRAGLQWWQGHAATLARAEAEFGVPAEVVVAIVGIETLYGRHMGGFRVLDALSTLAFDFPPGRRDRSAFFRSELESFLVWTRREGLEPTTPVGSFAGAIGLPQFMPSSILKYGIDYDADGFIDLRGNPVDVIGSVASYLRAFGWVPGLPPVVGIDAPVDSADRAALLAPDILPTFSADDLTRRGARLHVRGTPPEGPFALVELQNGEAAPTFYAGTRNFYAITRYNWSSYYAMAVIDLADALRAGRTASERRAQAETAR